ncbi:uncharacterized protein [Triticum aestivum]|uniref:uncharacterized protein n=1 Tax=Triticum aestivum TaxID=4565 RepID=UPI001D0246BB|nr:uncharacterized protein LOC123082764 [Triticum aestivum]
MVFASCPRWISMTKLHGLPLLTPRASQGQSLCLFFAERSSLYDPTHIFDTKSGGDNSTHCRHDTSVSCFSMERYWTRIGTSSKTDEHDTVGVQAYSSEERKRLASHGAGDERERRLRTGIRSLLVFATLHGYPC